LRGTSSRRDPLRCWITYRPPHTDTDTDTDTDVLQTLRKQDRQALLKQSKHCPQIATVASLGSNKVAFIRLKVKGGVETHLRATERHLPYGITHCYLPPDAGERAPP